MALDPADTSRYRQAVGVMLYVGSDRADCQYGIKLVSLHMAAPTDGPLRLVRHLAKYMVGTEDMSVVLPKHGDVAGHRDLHGQRLGRGQEDPEVHEWRPGEVRRRHVEYNIKEPRCRCVVKRRS